MTSRSLTSVSKATKWALSEFDTKCSDLDLHIRPDKCVSLSFDGSKLDKSFIVPLQDGNTRNISDIGARFLGSILMGTPRSTNSSSSNTLITTFRASLQALDARPKFAESISYGSTSIILPPLPTSTLLSIPPQLMPSRK